MIRSIEKAEQSTSDFRTLRVILPRHRKPFQPNDFSDVRQCETDQRVTAYLDAQLSWHWWRVPRRVVLEIAESGDTSNRCEMTEQSYRDLFRHRASILKRLAVGRLLRSLLLAVVGAAALYLSIQLSGSAEDSWTHTAGEIVRVVGWVSLWTAISGLVYRTSVTALSCANYLRIAHLPIEVSTRDAAGTSGAADRTAERMNAVMPR